MAAFNIRVTIHKETTGLPTIFSVTIMGCGGEGLSRDHLYNVGPDPSVNFVAATKSHIINFGQD